MIYKLAIVVLCTLGFGFLIVMHLSFDLKNTNWLEILILLIISVFNLYQYLLEKNMSLGHGGFIPKGDDLGIKIFRTVAVLPSCFFTALLVCKLLYGWQSLLGKLISSTP